MSSSTSAVSTRTQLSSMLYERWNLDESESAEPSSISRTLTRSVRSSTIWMTTPRVSRPRRPARPLIWMYSPDER
jgi:hypothetical protein